MLLSSSLYLSAYLCICISYFLSIGPAIFYLYIHPSILHPPTHLSIYLLSICPTTHPSIYLSFFLSSYLYIHPSIYLSIHPPIYLLSVFPTNQPPIYLSIYIYIYPCICLSAYLSSVYISTHLSICLSVCLILTRPLQHSMYCKTSLICHVSRLYKRNVRTSTSHNPVSLHGLLYLFLPLVAPFCCWQVGY
jgi:hypothetical protein